MDTARIVASLLALLLLGSWSSDKTSVYRLLCTGALSVTADTAEYIRIRTMSLDKDKLLVQLQYGLRAYPKGTHPIIKPFETSGIGYELDGKPIVTINPVNHGVPTDIILSFSGMGQGKHRIRIGLAGESGDLLQDNAYCFSTPGYFFLTGKLYL
jgi:hypothetical protein